MKQFRSTHYRPCWHAGPWPRATWKLGSVLLAVQLITSVATPAFAGKPDHGHHGGRQSRQHELSAAGKRHGKSKRVTRSFSNGDAIAIPAEDAVNNFGPAGPYPSSINVSGFKKGQITDLNLTLRGFSHTFPTDVDVLLVAPDGSNAVVMGDVGEIDVPVTDLTLTLDDEAADHLPVGEPLTSGLFEPLDNMGLTDTDNPALLTFPTPAPTPSGDTALSAFDGSSPNGQWQLFVLDDTEADTGALAGGWSLQITAQVKTKKHRH